MEARLPPEYQLDLSTDRSSAKDVIRELTKKAAILHTIFFHRVFTALYPSTHEVLDITLPYVSDDDVETAIDQQTASFLRKLDAGDGQSSPKVARRGQGQLTVNFLEKKRKKSGWFVTKADEETVWEIWVVNITITSARSEPEAARNRISMESSLENAALKVLSIVNEERNHIPPITTNESNPFPFQILTGAKG